VKRVLVTTAVLVAAVALGAAGICLIAPPIDGYPVPAAVATKTPAPAKPSATSPNATHRHRPDAISIAALGSTSPIVSAGVDATGNLAVPGLDTVGWDDQTAPPGSDRGTTILASHSDQVQADGTDEDGVWRHLNSLQTGDPISVTWHGRRIDYVVQRVQIWHSIGRLPAATVDRSSAPRIVLVSCGGQVEHYPDGWHWDARVLVWAAPR